MKEIVFITTNKGKLATAQKHLKDVKITHCDLEVDEPYVNDLDFIATYKVKKGFEKIKKPCISLDAGFYITNYPDKPGFPGAFPKRDLIEKIGIDGLLDRMKNVENRECYFKESLAYYDGKEVKIFHGYNKGVLSKEKKGVDTVKKWSDLWYVFIPFNCTKTMAEMTEEERKNRSEGYISPFIEFNKWFSEQKI